MNTAYNTLYLLSKENEAPRLVNDACYSKLFYWLAAGDEYQDLEVRYRLDSNEIDVRRANWWYLHFIKPAIIKRVVPYFSIKRYRKDAHEKLRIADAAEGELTRETYDDKNASSLRAFNQNYHAWLKLNVELGKIDATDLYVLLCLFRYPEGHPDIVNAVYKLVKDEGMDIQQAFVKAHLDQKENSPYGHRDHMLLGAGQWFAHHDRKWKAPDFNVHDIWTDLKTYKNPKSKVTISKQFGKYIH